MRKTKEMTLISLLAIIITISGSFKIPGPLPGTEFQLSAPIAVAIAASFGFKRYITAGMIASAIALALGTHTVIHVIIAIIFRVVAGGILHFFKPRFITITVAGPLGSMVARIALGFLLKMPIGVMLIASLPGMLYTAITAWPLSKLMIKIKYYTPFREVSYEGKSI
ncbi:hypothetical protein [Clostridium formicaceticum]|uniref:Uncharacterized protein n=1 Tax=Clostridium formicaceticum TaxID=1497 RepID=A0AAC9RKG7_9CLOT|nr:hypothetical protein [Clostridium formicaceticum]AOY76531.1 hypothetical protein BJL90_12070 [Clostridium formicaceticum]ARE86943.1 hypothetical protein CLFO_13270 [Clostridium formicaceticum]